MITLQSFVTPEREICTEHDLYYRAHGTVGFSENRREFILTRGAQLDFGTYFNMFSLGKWTQACDLDDLFVELSGQGEVEIRVRHAIPDRSWNLPYCEIVTLEEGQPHVIDLSAYTAPETEGTLFVEVRALANRVVITGGRFTTTTQPHSWPKLAVSITTFKREAEVRMTVARLARFLDRFEQGERIHVQVVDNGQSAEIASTDQVTDYPNRNLGGAGGFARGLLEAEAAGFSHCLFMDDDASFHMENIARSYMFLALARDPRTALAGAMINNTHKWQMWENGAWFDGSCRPLFCGTDLRDLGQVVGMEFVTTRHRPDTFYGGWWFFAFRIDQVSHHPFPFFVRGDDISFSLANDFETYTLNGVVSFQDDFTEKESAQTLYLDLRNHLIHHLVFDPLTRSPLGTAKIALRFMMRSMLRCHYESAEAQLLAWQDVMQGPDFFDKNIDMSERRARIKALAGTEVWQPYTAQSKKEKRRFSKLPRRLRHYFGLFTLNGHLLPFWGLVGDRMVLPMRDRGLVFPAFGGRELFYLSTDQSKGYTVRHSKARFFGLCWQMTKTLLRFNRSYPALKAAYRQGYDEMTTRAYWQKTLN